MGEAALLSWGRFSDLRARLRIAVYSSVFVRWWFRKGRRHRLTIVPQDLRTSDPVRADELLNGHYAFAGKLVTLERQSPFAIKPPSEEWGRVCHSFGWLRHLRAASGADYNAHARMLVNEWIDHHGHWNADSWASPVLAARLRAWLTNSASILDGADSAFYDRFVGQIATQTRFLSAHFAAMPPGVARLEVLIALAMAGLSMDGFEQTLTSATRRLARELDVQILGDGGHISRNPGAVIDLLADLLPLRRLYVVRNITPPAALVAAIDRMIPALRFFRGGDGALATFNGMGPTQVDLIATILLYDETRGHVPAGLPHSGYQRLAAGEAQLLVDCGTPPPPSVSQFAHAGALSFNFWDGRQPIVVNCGHSSINSSKWREIVRATAAHSTLCLENESAGTFVASARADDALMLVDGPSMIKMQRSDDGAASYLQAVHDGYQAAFGLLHQRQMKLDALGEVLQGQDELIGEGPGRSFALRFHLHPAVRPTLADNHLSVLLQLPNRRIWVFNASAPCRIDESVFLSGSEGPRRTTQIVIDGNSAELRQVNWTFYVPTMNADEEPELVEPELPL